MTLIYFKAPSSTTSTSASNKNFFISAYDEFLSSTVDKYVEASKKCAAPVYEIVIDFYFVFFFKI
jgi:hypothetical protein